MEFNLADLFESLADAIPDRECLVCGDTRLTYSSLDERANRLAHHLADAGVEPGQHVGVQLYNGPEYVTAMVACFKIRAVPVNVNYRYVEEELAYLFNDADLVALIHEAEFADRVAAVAPRVPTLKHFISVGEPTPDFAVDFDAALAAASPERGFGERSGKDLYIIYTGGTTGMPKGVMWRHEDIFFAGMGGGEPVGEPVKTPEEIGARAADRYPLVMFPVAPLMHGAAQLATWISFLQASKTVLLRKFDPVEVIRLIEREKVNSVSLVGDAMARPIAEALAGECKGADLSSVVAISSAGAILSETVKDLLRLHVPDYTNLLDNFGASETGFTGTGVAGSSPDKGLRFTVNDRTAVLGDDLKPVTPGTDEVGRVAQRGYVPMGYYGDEAKTKETFVEVDGVRWVLLGDLARVEEDGTISVLGRASLCINTGGEKVFPDEVEAALKAHPAIFDAIVVGVPDEKFGNKVAALVQLREEVDAPSVAEIQEHCRTRVAGYKVPRLVELVPGVQRSPSGKPDYPWATKVAAEAAKRVGSAT